MNSLVKLKRFLENEQINDIERVATRFFTSLSLSFIDLNKVNKLGCFNSMFCYIFY